MSLRDTGNDRRRRRRTLVAAIPAVVVAGLAARYGLSGPLADGAGGIAYAALMYLLLALLWPTLPPFTVGAGAFGVSALVELFQLTPLPADLADRFSPAHLVLGEGFAATDLLAYAVGAVVATGVDAALQRRRHRQAG